MGDLYSAVARARAEDDGARIAKKEASRDVGGEASTRGTIT